MANREELGIIKRARTGDSHAQLILGKRYLFGSAGLPKSLPTALHWLQRSAQQDCVEACLLIGAHIPHHIARQSGAAVIPFYERAYDEGVLPAGLVLAQLVLDGGDAAGAPGLHAKALRGLRAAAQAGLGDAQWLLAQHSADAEAPKAAPGAAPRDGQAWLTRAADNGVSAALYTVLGQDWEEGARERFLLRALPMARQLLREAGDGGDGAKKPAPAPLAPQAVLLLSRCAQIIGGPDYQGEVGHAELYRFYELAANSGDRAAQLALGLWFARMDAQGARVRASAGVVNFKRAIRWLTQAGEQGLAEAWFALSRIYIKPEFSQRSVMEAQSYLERAADMGHSAAQLECGIHAWRTRRDGENNDVRAAYWLLKAAAQGSAEAENALCKIAPCVEPAQWGQALASLDALELAGSQPFLAARLELASLFGLSRAEALLLDLNAADQGHCLVIDIRASYGRGKRRLVLLRTAQQRQALDRIVRLFDNVDCGFGGPEGNYRQRLYRLKTYVPELPEAPRGLLPA